MGFYVLREGCGWTRPDRDETIELYYNKRIKIVQGWSDVNHFSNPYMQWLSQTFFFSWITCKSCCLCGTPALSSPAQTYPLARCFCSWVTPPECAKEATALQNNTLAAVPVVAHLLTCGPKMFIAHRIAQYQLCQKDLWSPLVQPPAQSGSL